MHKTIFETHVQVYKDIYKNVSGICWMKLGDVILEPLFVSCPVDTYKYCPVLDKKRQSSQTRVDLFILSCCVSWRLLHYLHDLCGLHGMKQTYSQMLVFIVHCYHIKADNFRHSQQDRNNPYQSYFDCCPH